VNSRFWLNSHTGALGNKKDTIGENIFTKHHITIIITFSLLILADTAVSQVITVDSLLAAHIAAALKNNPEIAALSASLDAARQRVSQAGAWHDPTVKFSLMNLPLSSFDFNQENMTGAWLSIGQAIPAPGKTRLKTDISESNAKIAAAEQFGRELKLAESLALIWFEWAYLLEKLTTLNHDIQLMDNLIVIARSKYETGSGLQHDILRAETKRSKQDDTRIKLAQTISTVASRFATLIGLHSNAAPLPPSILPDEFSELEAGGLSDLMYQHNPAWAIMVIRVESSGKKVDLAKLAVLPDLKLGAAYGFRQATNAGLSRPDFFSISAGITVPLYKERKQNAGVREKIAMQRSALLRKNSLRLELDFMLRKLVDEDRRLAEQILLYKDGILPQAEATLAASTSSYSIGKADFEALLMAESVLYNTALEKLERIRDRLKTRASIAALTGGSSLMGL